jgi:AcrR family transcriptional regulator
VQRLTRAEKKAETRRRLLEAAGHVFIERGFQGASVEAICAEAGFTRGAFYSNFESKEEMFVELLQERAYEGYRQLLRDIPTDLSPIEKLRFGAHALERRYADENQAWLFELWLECLAHAARHPEFRSLAATFWSGTRAMNAGAMEADGPPLPIEAKHLATAMTALDIGLAVQHLVDPDEVPLELYPRLYELLFGPLFETE